MDARQQAGWGRMQLPPDVGSPPPPSPLPRPEVLEPFRQTLYGQMKRFTLVYAKKNYNIFFLYLCKEFRWCCHFWSGSFMLTLHQVSEQVQVQSPSITVNELMKVPYQSDFIETSKLLNCNLNFDKYQLENKVFQSIPVQ